MTKILRAKETCLLLSVSPMTLWRWRRSAGFPGPIALGPNSKGYLADEVEAWIAARKAERDAQQQRRTVEGVGRQSEEYDDNSTARSVMTPRNDALDGSNREVTAMAATPLDSRKR